jgi:hypothetical protein
MKKINVKAFIPHAVAVAVFLAVAFIYCRPALQGKVLQQSDVSAWKGAIQNSVEYAKTHNGKYPLWSNGLFSGMPAFQIGGINGNEVGGYIHNIITLGLPKPVNFFFLASICFYFLCVCLRIRPWAGILGALAFAYATYNPIIISVGHDTKMLAIAYMPALLGAIILLLDKKYIAGFILTVVFSSLIIMVNHLQIVYYLFIALAVMMMVSLVRSFKEKQFKNFVIAAALAAVAVVTGVATNAEALMSTFEYQKETIRGGQSLLSDSTTKKQTNTTGLDKDYALAYSLNVSEPLVLMVPRIFGGSSDHEEMNPDKSKAIEALNSMPRELQQQFPPYPAFYWGGIKDVGGNVYTSGPPYTGAIICFLAILGMFVLDGKHKWWMLAAILTSVLLSWGQNLEGLNTFLFNNLPFYNKFRAPSMIMVIPQLLLPALAVLCVDKIIGTEDKTALQKLFMRGLIATGAVFVLLFLMYFSFDFLSSSDNGVLKQVRGMNQPQLLEYVQSFYNGLKDDRKSLMMGDIFRSLGFVLAAAALVYLFIKNTIKPWLLIGGLSLFSFVDLMMVNNTYLNTESYKEKEEEEAVFTRTPKDEQILQDKSDYRVFNMSGNAFSENTTSYLYKSAGGYHAAKLRLYQDLIEKQLSKPQPNMAVFDMLNVKYFIQKNGGLTQNVQQNPGALGSAWLVKNIQFVKDADAEMKALDNFNPKDTAFVQDAFKTAVPFMPEADSTAGIKLVKNDNDIITYEFSSTKNQFAVFSEIYYKAGWKAFANGKELPIAKVNYVLRGLALTPGKYTVEFKFEPQGYLTGKKLTGIFSLIMGLLLFGGIGWGLYSVYKKSQ